MYTFCQMKMALINLLFAQNLPIIDFYQLNNPISLN